METITATQAAKSLSDYLTRVQHRAESFAITRNGETVASLVPALGAKKLSVGRLLEMTSEAGLDEEFAEDLQRIQASQPRLAEDPWRS